MQNINLYQHEQRDEGGPRPRSLLLGLLLLSLLLGLHAAWQGWRSYQAAEAAQTARQQAAQAQQQLDAVKANYREPVLDPALPARVTARESENRQLQRMADYLRDLDLQRRGGFVAYLLALADRHPPSGLWLTRIHLLDGGSELALYGLSQNQELFPLYLESLGRSEVFRGRQFARFEILRDQRDLLEFRLASRQAGEGRDE
ncbi:MSHA biogenesis protein MshI [Stutzerimonas kirkiae]|uniref:MSHA biogenesis protein MshI n=1 Tax=Stutzerimonas kirkiae TaxID=2211392 RepID=A0A4Q9RFG5_9GAMM|nr:MSHA biogenesis protein MshI [Stutzerimonas kirkiae]TBU99951.1 MSHA biogenesis protein MshI [Stutzerimonas kirkiae]TBV05657.1 MSHA biogenesis protein MshI [Stutzerimonas kirkiae]TBV10602.1 MSHA biogenesis protein MshI [Stutzerimonas kirkiae]TBV17457.1 MSHA biogenesis protein MshI [Stutzerimonas kirkiae]